MSLVGEAGYRETEIGWIPSDWQARKLGELVAKIGSGVTPKGGSDSYLPSGVPLIRSQNILWGRLSLNDVAYISDEQHERMANSALKPLDVLLNITGASIGRCAVLPGNFLEGNVNQHVCIIRPSESLQSGFLSHYMISEFGQEQINKLQAGGNREGLNYQQIRGFTIAHPPASEQQKIAAILTAVDDKLDLIARQISATQTLKQGLMQTLFTRGVGTQDAQGRWQPHTEFKDSELGRIPVGWEEMTLEEVATVERGKFSARPRNDPKYFEGGDIPFIQTGDIAAATRFVSKSSQFLNEEGLAVSRLFPTGTIFITIAANIGDVAISTIPMACPDSLVSILPNNDQCNGRWLFYLLKGSKEYFDSQSTQNAQKNINLQVLRPFAFAMPPLDEQVQIAACLSSIDDKLDSLTVRQTHYQTLKRGLMQKLLTGEWRVKVDAAVVATNNVT